MRVYGRIPRTGATTLGFTTYNATMIGTTFTASAAAWANGAVATSGFPNVAVSWTVPPDPLLALNNGPLVIGLSTASALPFSGSSPAYGLEFGLLTNTYSAIVGGVTVATLAQAPATGDIGTVSYNGATVQFFVNGVLLYAAALAGATLYPGVLAYNAGATATLAISPSAPGAGSQWVEVDTDANGNNDLVYVTALCQALLLNLNESPFYANFGIPAQASVAQQIPPDYYVAMMQQAYAPYFASLMVSRSSSATPTYQINILTHQGVRLNASVPIPT
jgi:hypothetical protein